MIGLQQPTTALPEGWRASLDHIVFVAIVVVVALVLTGFARRVIRFVLERFAARSRSGKSNMWLARMPRLLHENDALASLRRDQRVRSTATMLSRIVNVAIWLLALFVILAGLQVDVVWAVSSAGFLGAAIAIGGQHSVHDYVNGLHVLIEDRFGEGDTIIVAVDGDPRTAVVDRLGTFTTRLKYENATWHIANRHLSHVDNLSQNSNTVDIGITLAGALDRTQATTALRQSLREVLDIGGTSHTVIVDDLETLQDPDGSGQNYYRIKGRTTAAVNTVQHDALVTDLAKRLQR